MHFKALIHIDDSLGIVDIVDIVVNNCYHIEELGIGGVFQKTIRYQV